MTDMTATPEAGSATPREARLLDGLAGLKPSRSAVDGQRVLFLLGALLVSLGFLLIMIAWRGSAETGAVFEQVPFLISGGLGGLGLMVAGSALYLGWWLTRQVRQSRQQHLELLARQDELAAAVRQLADAVASWGVEEEA